MKAIFLVTIVALMATQQQKQEQNQNFFAGEITKPNLKFDTLIAVRRLWLGESVTKTAVTDTIVLVAEQHRPFGNTPKKAGYRYEFTPVAYNPFDTVTPSKAVARDTLIWVSKPYRP